MDNTTIIHQWSQMPRSLMEAFGDTGDFARQYLLTPTILALLGSVQDALGITYHQADLSRLDYPPYHYDTVVANMVLMDIPDDTAAIAACLHHLHPGGNFVFSISHPCFEAPDQDYAEHGYLTIAEYFSEYPIPQRWGTRFHRPLSHYVNTVIQHDGELQQIVEPQLDAATAQAVPLAVRHVHIPGFLVVLARKRPKRAEC